MELLDYLFTPESWKVEKKIFIEDYFSRTNKVNIEDYFSRDNTSIKKTKIIAKKLKKK